MAIEDAYQLAKDLSKATDSFREPWFNLEKVLVVSLPVLCDCCSYNSSRVSVRLLVDIRKVHVVSCRLCCSCVLILRWQHRTETLPCDLNCCLLAENCITVLVSFCT